jgi:hypothetical protein
MRRLKYFMQWNHSTSTSVYGSKTKELPAEDDRPKMPETLGATRRAIAGKEEKFRLRKKRYTGYQVLHFGYTSATLG